MGLFRPKYPPGAEPPKTPSRRERRAAAQTANAQPAAGPDTITEADLRRYEQAGWIVERNVRGAGGRQFAVVSRKTPGGSEMRSFGANGDGTWHVR